MSNVVYVDFSKYETDERQTERQAYLELLRNELDPLDYLDVLEATTNIELYQAMDRDLQDLVDGYLACKY